MYDEGRSIVIRTFQCYYWLLFLGIGCLYPMIAIYFEEIGLTGSEIGVLLSIGPLLTIFAQPIWGLISDRFQKPTYSLIIASCLSGIIALGFLIEGTFIYYIAVASILAVFHSPLVPITDSVTLNYIKENQVDYGRIRLWGAVGFAMAVWITGLIIEMTFTGIIFYIFSIVLFIVAITAVKLPNQAELMKTNIPAAIKKLFAIPTYILLLCSTFLVFGAMNANNFYFGLYYISIGGTIAGVGFVFLLAAGSEAPIMKMANYCISKYGLVNILLFSAIISGIRWGIFFMEPSIYMIIGLFILQGISIGLYIPASVLLVREISPEDVKVTSMSIFSSVGHGLGTTFCTFAAGYVLNFYAPSYLYLFFFVVTIVGIGFLVLLKRKYDENSKLNQFESELLS